MASIPSTNLPAQSEAVRLAFPSCESGIGRVITSPESRDLILGVIIESFMVWPDDRGVFFEVARSGQGAVSRFPLDSLQVSATFTHAGSIKAFHYHLHQTDCWVPSMGMLQVALVDLRDGSATLGLKNTLYVGEHRRWQILIPPGVAHGYKVIGNGTAGLIYITNRFYDPNDEGRLAYDDSRLNYDWELQHK